MDYLLLAVLWITWCFFHSAMISLTVTRFLDSHLKPAVIGYRLFFNSVAGVSLLLLAGYSHSLERIALFQWTGAWWLLKGLMLAGALFFFVAGSRQYDMDRFLGLRQIRTRNISASLDRDDTFTTSGILAWTRHPWYAGTFLFLWSWFNTLYLSTLIVNVILTVYVVVGTLLEEKKLIARYGEAYRKYQKQVPMFFPGSRFLSRG